jgi:hypothetical protein
MPTPRRRCPRPSDMRRVHETMLLCFAVHLIEAIWRQSILKMLDRHSRIFRLPIHCLVLAFR